MGRPEVHEDWVVSALITFIESQLSVFEHVSPVVFDKAVERALGQTYETRAVRIVQWRTSRAPKWYCPWTHEFGIAEDVGNWTSHRQVEVTANKVNVKHFRVCVEALEEVKWLRHVSWRQRCVGGPCIG